MSSVNEGNKPYPVICHKCGKLIAVVMTKYKVYNIELDHDCDEEDR